MRAFVIGVMVALLFRVAAEESSQLSLFPVDEDVKTGITRSKADRYSKQLRAMKEESLQPLAKDKGAEVYRFTYLAAFAHPRSIRLVKKDDAYEIIFRQADGDGRFNPGELDLDLSAKMDLAKVEEFKKLFKEASFFAQGNSAGGEEFDGSQWILEAVTEGKYHILDRRSPELDEKDNDLKAFVAVCDWLQKNAPEDEVGKERVRKAKEQVTDEEKSLGAFGDWPDWGLSELGETLLSPLAKDPSAEVYRLAIKPSFNSVMVVILIKEGNKWRITHRGSDASIHMDPRKAPSHATVKIPPEKAAEFRKLFDATSFLKMETPNDQIGFDGENWILEAVRDGKYHGVTRWSPDASTDERGLTAFLACCQWLKDHVPDNEEDSGKK